MSRRASRAGLCALAALAFLLAAFLPWFESQRGDGRGDDDHDGPRASYQLQGGERCERGRCRALGYTGARGLSDELFAGLGWATLAGALGAVALTLTVAGVRRRNRPLRAWAAVSAALTASLAALFVASETISRGDDLARGWGLVAITMGAILAGLGVAAPTAPPVDDRRPERRWALAVGLAGGAGVAWLSLANHGWWRGVGAFREVAASPLALEICDGDDCQSGALSIGGTGFALFARLTVALTAALLVPATGAAIRAAWGRATGAWGLAAATLAIAALVTGAATAALHPSAGVDNLSWGLPAFAAALLAVTASSALGRRWITAADDDDPPAPVAVAAPRAALAPRPSGAPRPVLAPLAAPPQAPLPAAAPALVPPTPPMLGAPTTPAWPAPSRDDVVAARPRFAAVAAAPAPTPVAAPPPLGRRASPVCPGCRQATLWHGKRGAWWCSGCKRVL